MDRLYTLSRIYAGFMGFIILGGILWFASPLSGTVVIAGTIAGVSSIVASLIPQRKLSDHSIRRILISACMIGIGAGLVLLIDDLSASRGIEWDVVTMKGLDIIALTTMAIRVLKQLGKAQ